MTRQDQEKKLTVDLPQGTVAFRDEGRGRCSSSRTGSSSTHRSGTGWSSAWFRPGFAACGRRLRWVPTGFRSTPRRLSPPRVADLLADFVDALDLGPVTVVGSDSGGAVSQMFAAQHPDKLAAMVLTNCDALEVYPPFPFTLLPPLARMPGGIAPLGLLMKLKPVRWATYRMLTADPIPDRQLKAWLGPTGSNPGIRRDVNKVIGGLEKNQAIDAAEKLRGFEKPVLFAWGESDRFFKPELAERLAAMIPNSRIEKVEGGRTFVALDDPEKVSNLIVEFMNGAVTPAGRTDAQRSTRGS